LRQSFAAPGIGILQQQGERFFAMGRRGVIINILPVVADNGLSLFDVAEPCQIATYQKRKSAV
jgi:hypothetical protein